MKVTPVLIVDHVEPSLAFWVDRMGFTKTMEVPDGDTLGFAGVALGAAEIMFQTVESVRKDDPSLLPPHGAATNLFIEVDDFEDTLRRLDGYPVAMHERTTFYGMREIGVREPGGHAVIFAKAL